MLAAATTLKPKKTVIKAKVDTNNKKKKKLLKPQIMRSGYNNKENQSELTDEIP